MVIFGGIAAVGAGLHVAAYYLEDTSHLGAEGTVLTVAVPVGVVILGIYGLYSTCARPRPVPPVPARSDVRRLLALALVLAANGVSMAVCLLVLGGAPLVTVVGYELLGHRHLAAALARAVG